MNNPKEYLTALAAKHGEPPAEWMAEEAAGWRQSLAGLGANWDHITDVELTPLGGRWQARIRFANGLVIGSYPDTPLPSLAEAERLLAHLGAVIRSNPIVGERVIFALNDVGISITVKELLTPEWIRETAAENGVTEEYFLEDILVWAADEFERTVDRCGGDLKRANLVEKMRLKVAAQYMIANDQYSYCTKDYFERHMLKHDTVPAGHA